MIDKSELWNNQVQVHLDLSYIPTVSGGLKLIQILLSIVCLICTATFPYYLAAYAAMGWLQFASISSLITTLALLLFQIFHIQDKLSVIPWKLLELIYCSIWSVFHLSGAVALLQLRIFLPALISAAVFALLLVIAYGADLILRLMSLRHAPSPLRSSSPPVIPPRVTIDTVSSSQCKV